jgi:hypothetical protein
LLTRRLAARVPEKIMLKEAVDYYNELLEDFDLAERSRLNLDMGLDEAKLIFGGRIL